MRKKILIWLTTILLICSTLFTTGLARDNYSKATTENKTNENLITTVKDKTNKVEKNIIENIEKPKEELKKEQNEKTENNLKDKVQEINDIVSGKEKEISKNISDDIIKNLARKVTARNNVIKSFNVTNVDGTPIKGEIEKWQNFKITGTFELPNNVVKKGDTTTIKLPDVIYYTSGSTSFELKTPSGEVVANAVVDIAKKEIVFTYTDYAEKHSDVKGSFYFNARFDHTVIKTQKEIALEFKIDREIIFSNKIQFKGVGTPEKAHIIKSGYPTTGDPNSMSYYIALNRSNVAINNAKLSDTLDSNVKGKILLDSVLITKGKWEIDQDKSEWMLKDEQDVTEKFKSKIKLSNDGKKLDIELGNIAANEGYALSYKVALEYQPINGEKFRNTAAFTGDGNYTHIATIDSVYIGAGGDAEGYNFTIKIHKENEEGASLKGAEFDVIRKATNQVVGKIVTDDKGNGQIAGLLKTDYIIKETKAPLGYKLSDEVVEVKPSDFGSDKSVLKTIKNKKNTTFIKVVKYWDDDYVENKPAIDLSNFLHLINNENSTIKNRPKQIKVQLYKSVDGDKETPTGKEAVLSEATNWTAEFTELPVEENGKTIKYNVKEVDIPEGYTPRITEDKSTNRFIIENIKREISVQFRAKKSFTHSKTGENKLRANQFEFKLYDSNGKLVDTVTNDKDGVITFKKIIFNQTQAGKTYNYKIVETKTYIAEDGTRIENYPGVSYDSKEHTVSVKVDYDEQEKKLTATILGGNNKPIEFKNTYNPAPETEETIKAKKTLEGKNLEKNQFEFELIDVKTGQVIQKAKNNELGEIKFSPIKYSENELGEHNYKIREVVGNKLGITYDTTIKELTVTVTKDEKTNTLHTKISKTENELNFVNKYAPIKTKVEGVKTWDDQNNQSRKRPSKIIVKLLADGVEIASKEVTEKDNWKCSFDNLDKYKDEKEIKYTIEEEKVDGYETIIDNYNITNKLLPPPPSVPKLPKTGIKNSQTALAGVSIFTLLALAIRKRKQ